MEFKISCEQFARIATASYQPGEPLGSNPDNTAPHVPRPELSCVRLEHRKGNTYAIASNAMIIVIEFIGPTKEADGHVHITNLSTLVDQAKAEVDAGSDFNISHDPVSGYTMLISTRGYMFPGDANTHLEGAWAARDWEKFLTEPPTKSDTAFLFNGKWLARMAAASPSGNFVLPKHVMKNVPVVVRDRIDPSWIGIFLVPRVDTVPHAVLPEWVKLL